MPMGPFTEDTPLRVAIAGFGNVGQTVAPRLVGGDVAHCRLTAISAADLEKARRNSADLDPTPRVVPTAELPDHADVVVECATYDAFPLIARAVLGAGKPLIAVSAGALGANLDLIDLAKEHGTYIHVASGALPGLDIIRAARESDLRSVTLSTRLRPDALAREPYVTGKGFDFATPPEKPVMVFKGTAREGAAAFPRHFNVAVALSLAGIGLDRTMIEMYCDGAIPGPIHRVEVDSEAVGLTMESRNLPSPANKNTGRIVAPSIIAALREMVSPIRVGS